MNIILPDRVINVFSVIYRNEDIQEYSKEFVFDFISKTKAYGFSGLLLFEANRSNLDPWIIGQLILHEGLTPFIAINPIYMHPFTAARKVASLTNLFEQRLFINFITGTSSSDLSNLNDSLTHDERYQRLEEYIYVFDQLLKSKVPLNFEGKYYKVKNLLLSAKPNSQLFPRYFIAGSSAMTEKIIGSTGAFKATMGKDLSQLPCLTMGRDLGAAMHFGVLAKPTNAAATKQLQEWTSIDETSQKLFLESMNNTQSRWKQELSTQLQPGDQTFSLVPLKSMKADCPYYVGSYEEVANLIVRIVLNGYSTLMIETPFYEEDLRHIQATLELAESRLRERHFNTIEFNFKL